jgi:hypothetical protein
LRNQNIERVKSTVTVDRFLVQVPVLADTHVPVGRPHIPLD